jgi:hypothetical protein
MKFAILTVGAVIALVGVVALVGWLLPAGHTASRTADLAGSPQAAFDAVRDVAGYPGWRTGVTRVDILESTPDVVRFREHSSDGAMTMEIVEANPPVRIVTRIADPDQPFAGTWTFGIGPGPAGARVTITERGEIYNPIFRFMARFVFGHHQTLDKYLDDLARHLRARARS